MQSNREAFIVVGNCGDLGSDRFAVAETDSRKPIVIFCSEARLFLIFVGFVVGCRKDVAPPQVIDMTDCECEFGFISQLNFAGI